MFLRDTSDILERIAIADVYGKQYSYGDLELLSSEYKRYIPRRSLIMILCDYAIETVAFYYCQMTNHAVPILVDKNLKPDLLLRIIKAYEPQFIWCSEEIENTLCDVVSKVVLKGEKHFLIQTIFETYEMYSRLALLLTTSGSTGSLKLVRLSYENIRKNISAYIERIDINENDRGITTLPMHYCYGLSILHMHWMAGGCIYVAEYSLLDVRFWDFFEKAKITNFAGVPYTYDILKQIDFLKKDYDSLRFVTQGGGKLPAMRQIEFGLGLREKNIKLYICYGQTEATTYISILSHLNVVEKLESVGKAIPGLDVSIRNSDDKGEGELVCEGDTISLGYAINKLDLIRENDNFGCLYTGDIVYIDEEGDIFIKGRKSRIVKILGERVSLDELETELAECFDKSQFACVGEDNRIRIYYSEKGLENGILKFCKKELCISKKFIECYWIDKMPYMSNGKINYGDLK